MQAFVLIGTCVVLPEVVLRERVGQGAAWSDMKVVACQHRATAAGKSKAGLAGVAAGPPLSRQREEDEQEEKEEKEEKEGSTSVFGSRPFRRSRVYVVVCGGLHLGKRTAPLPFPQQRAASQHLPFGARGISRPGCYHAGGSRAFGRPIVRPLAARCRPPRSPRAREQSGVRHSSRAVFLLTSCVIGGRWMEEAARKHAPAPVRPEASGTRRFSPGELPFSLPPIEITWSGFGCNHRDGFAGNLRCCSSFFVPSGGRGGVQASGRVGVGCFRSRLLTCKIQQQYFFSAC
ncbi:unnamed protein product [Hapterophycus canaliculatus]